MDEVIAEAVKAYAPRVNASPHLTSLLYDVGLLPEQVETIGDALHMGAVVVAFETGVAVGKST